MEDEMTARSTIARIAAHAIHDLALHCGEPTTRYSGLEHAYKAETYCAVYEEEGFSDDESRQRFVILDEYGTVVFAVGGSLSDLGSVTTCVMGDWVDALMTDALHLWRGQLEAI